MIKAKGSSALFIVRGKKEKERVSLSSLLREQSEYCRNSPKLPSCALIPLFLLPPSPYCSHFPALNPFFNSYQNENISQDTKEEGEKEIANFIRIPS